MPKPALLLGIFITSLAWPGLAVSQSSSGQDIPDFSGAWARTGELNAMLEAIPGHEGAGPVLVDPLHPHIRGASGPWVAALDNPIFKPKTLEKLRVISEAELEGIPHVKNEGMCQPSGVPMLWNRVGGAVQILQTSTQVTILNARDHQVRNIYLNVPHSDDPGHSWYGESVGHYEGGNTLVVDTIGQNDKTQLDRFGTPHSDQIRVVERFILSSDSQSLEVQFMIEDPGAFTMPWSARVRSVNRIRDWDEQVCAENNRYVGEVTVNGEVTTVVPTPTDHTPDF